MGQQIAYPNGQTTVSIPAASSIAVATFGRGVAKVSQLGVFPNYPTTLTQIGTVSNGTSTFGPFSVATTIVVEAGADPVFFEVGVTPAVKSIYDPTFQPTPVAVNVTGAISALAIIGGIVTSTTAAAVAGTVPTAAVMDAASQFNAGDAVDWSVINTGGTNAFTVTAATGHTIVGTAAVAALTSGLFRTVCSTPGTYVTYRKA